MAEDKIKRISFHVKEMMKVLGLDLQDPNMKDTPRRVAKMYIEIFGGLENGNEPKITTFPNDEHYSNMVMVKDISFFSVCSHHLIPFFGRAHVAYIPEERIIGLSKLARIVEFYAKRPQLQERLTEQIIHFVEEKMHPQGSMVVVEGRHLCMEMRGVKKPGALTVTSAVRGLFKEDDKVREEFLKLLQLRREQV
ncbi:MAG: GTP cyclohydrolase I FolE [Candidatus Latescibacteria bacterium]|nr:GTP cyclohydrolase I FolE [Candidatus Latescibacterota bacterium]